MSRGKPRVRLDCFGEICDGAIAVALGVEGAAAVEVGVRVLRIDLDDLTIVRDCPVVITLFLEGVPAVEVSVGVLRLDLDRLAIIGDGTVFVPPGPVHDAAAKIGIGEARDGPWRRRELT